MNQAAPLALPPSFDHDHGEEIEAPRLQIKVFRDNWRPMMPSVVTVKNISGIGELCPEFTDGTIVQARRLCDNKIFFVHLENLVWPEKERKAPTRRKGSKDGEEVQRSRRVSKGEAIALRILELEQEKKDILAKLQNHA